MSMTRRATAPVLSRYDGDTETVVAELDLSAGADIYGEVDLVLADLFYKPREEKMIIIFTMMGSDQTMLRN